VDVFFLKHGVEMSATRGSPGHERMLKTGVITQGNLLTCWKLINILIPRCFFLIKLLLLLNSIWDNSAVIDFKCN